MSEEQKNSNFKFATLGVNSSKKAEVPIATLNDILSKASNVNKKAIEYIGAEALTYPDANLISEIISDSAFIVGAVKYYLEKKDERNRNLGEETEREDDGS